MSKFPFLSEPWISETRRLRAEYADRIKPPSTGPMRMNLVINDAPDHPAGLDAHLDTSNGEPEIDLGHLDNAEVKVTVDYATARAVFVDGNLGAAMEGLQMGRIKVDGDIMKVMSLAGLQADPGSIELAKAIREVTA